MTTRARPLDAANRTFNTQLMCSPIRRKDIPPITPAIYVARAVNEPVEYINALAFKHHIGRRYGWGWGFTADEMDRLAATLKSHRTRIAA